MKLSDLEDMDQLVTKEWLEQTLKAEFAALRAELSALEARMTERLMTSERGQRMWIAGLYAAVIGIYGMVVAAIYINHLWH
jgi:hypothetical protein